MADAASPTNTRLHSHANPALHPPRKPTPPCRHDRPPLTRIKGAMSGKRATQCPDQGLHVAMYRGTLSAPSASCRANMSPRLPTKEAMSSRHATPSPDQVLPVAIYQGTLSAPSASVGEFWIDAPRLDLPARISRTRPLIWRLSGLMPHALICQPAFREHVP